jgi:DNA-binding transcriptional MocR family regulator
LRKEEQEFDLESLEKIIQEKKPKGFYLSASHNNPTGYNLSIKQRNALWNLALKYQFYLIVDDVYDLMYYGDAKRIPPTFYCSNEVTESYLKGGVNFVNYDHNQNPYVVSLNSFSKIIFPGWRCVSI